MRFTARKVFKKSLDILIPISYSVSMLLTTTMTMGETLDALPYSQQNPVSRFWFKSPCYFMRPVDVAIHIILPGMIEGILPTLARWLRAVSPRWGRSWREW